MRRCLTAVALVVAILLWGHPVSWAQQAPIVLKAGTAVGATSPLNDAMVVLDKALQEKSKGRLKIELHINNSIAKGEGAHLEGAQLGTIDVVAIGSAPIGGMFEPTYQALDLPFLWTSREQVWKVMDGPLARRCSRRWTRRACAPFASAAAG